jgi:hypothetical protein
MKRKSKAEKVLDAQIERAYYKHAQGKSIDVMKITKLYDDARSAVVSGSSVDDAVIAAVAKYCQAA